MQKRYVRSLVCSSFENTEPAYSSSVDLSNQSHHQRESMATRADTSTTEDTEAAMDRLANIVVRDVFGDGTSSIDVTQSSALREFTTSCTSKLRKQSTFPDVLQTNAEACFDL
jgi:hypothetical protein